MRDTQVFLACLVLVIGAACANADESSRMDDDLLTIFFRLYSGKTMDQYVDAPLLEVRNLVVRMKLEKPTVIYIHGYTGSANSKDNKAVIPAYLERGDHNVISVDWQKLAAKGYVNVVSSAKAVGEALAGAFDEIVDQGVPPDSIHVVAHSMGAQVAGFLGRQTSFELRRITGLDPAGPLFNFLEPHLTTGDARFVDTIHTDAGRYGIGRASGVASFYPNGGNRVQPGCPTDYDFSSPEDYCSHYRSWIFYAESLRNESAFIGTNCSSYSTFSSGNCNANTKVLMGFATPTNAKGLFYLETRSKAPFGMQMKGALSKVSRPALNNFIQHRQ